MSVYSPVEAKASRVFREALEELLFTAPALGTLARGLGAPKFDHVEKTAYVALTKENDELKVRFAINPGFLAELDVDTASGVIAHEVHHVIFDHLNEMRDHTAYPDADSLIRAHECIINDIIEGVYGIQMPDFVYRGINEAGISFKNFNTPTAYKIIIDKKNELLSEDKKEKSDNTPSGVTTQPSSGESSGSQSSPSESASNIDQVSETSGKDKKDSKEDNQNGESGKNYDSTSKNKENSHETENSDAHDTPSCGGIIIDPSIDESEYKNGLNAIIQGIVVNAAKEMNITIEEFSDLLNNDTAKSYSPSGVLIFDESLPTSAELNWVDLLSRINPKIKNSGKKTKTQNNWTKVNRRMVSIYPKVILPVVEKRGNPRKGKGEAIPTFVVALDQSASIDRKLAGTLQNLLRTIPEDLLKAYAITWAKKYIEFDKNSNNNKIASGGTDIGCVVDYVKKVKSETNADPYVLVITDGDFSKNNYVTENQNKWFMMGVDKASERRILKHVRSENCYDVKDFLI